MHATSGDSKAKRTASRWLGFNESSKKVKSGIEVFSEGVDRPKRTRRSGVIGGEGCFKWVFGQYDRERWP